MRTAIAAIALAAAFAGGQARADEPAACSAFKWPLSRERAVMAGADLPRAPREPNERVRAGAYRMSLRAAEEVALPIATSRPPRPGSFGGVLRLLPPEASGLYQVTLSADAWIEVAQANGRPLPTAEFTGVRDCPGLRKSVRFQIEREPVDVQLSGAEEPEIRIIVAPAP